MMTMFFVSLIFPKPSLAFFDVDEIFREIVSCMDCGLRFVNCYVVEIGFQRVQSFFLADVTVSISVHQSPHIVSGGYLHLVGFRSWQTLSQPAPINVPVLNGVFFCQHFNVQIFSIIFFVFQYVRYVLFHNSPSPHLLLVV